MAGLCAAHNPFSHLVVVCGHGTYRGEGDPHEESSWILEKFRQSDSQTGKPGEHHTFVQHIEAGKSVLEYDPSALLVFSGGRTQNEISSTEAGSYRQAFLKLGGSALEWRTATEDLATDSFQNLLFSLLVFKRKAGLYPRRITVITHAFKERRFLESHAPALKWPTSQIRTIGINPSFTRDELESVQKGEYNNAFRHFLVDPYGMHSPLMDKRLARNWDESVYTQLVDGVQDEQVKALIQWTGGQSGRDVFGGSLPWSS